MDPGFVQRWLKWFYEQGDVSTPAQKKRAYGRHDKASILARAAYQYPKHAPLCLTPCAIYLIIVARQQ